MEFWFCGWNRVAVLLGGRYNSFWTVSLCWFISWWSPTDLWHGWSKGVSLHSVYMFGSWIFLCWNICIRQHGLSLGSVNSWAWGVSITWIGEILCSIISLFTCWPLTQFICWTVSMGEYWPQKSPFAMSAMPVNFAFICPTIFVACSVLDLHHGISDYFLS